MTLYLQIIERPYYEQFHVRTICFLYYCPEEGAHLIMNKRELTQLTELVAVAECLHLE